MLGAPSEVRTPDVKENGPGPSWETADATKQLLFEFKDRTWLARTLGVESPPDVFFVCVDSHQQVIDKGQWLLNWSWRRGVRRVF